MCTVNFLPQPTDILIFVVVVVLFVIIFSHFSVLLFSVTFLTLSISLTCFVFLFSHFRYLINLSHLFLLFSFPVAFLVIFSHFSYLTQTCQHPNQPSSYRFAPDVSSWWRRRNGATFYIVAFHCPPKSVNSI